MTVNPHFNLFFCVLQRYPAVHILAGKTPKIAWSYWSTKWKLISTGNTDTNYMRCCHHEKPPTLGWPIEEIRLVIFFLVAGSVLGIAVHQEFFTLFSLCFHVFFELCFCWLCRAERPCCLVAFSILALVVGKMWSRSSVFAEGLFLVLVQFKWLVLDRSLSCFFSILQVMHVLEVTSSCMAR